MHQNNVSNPIGSIIFTLIVLCIVAISFLSESGIEFSYGLFFLFFITAVAVVIFICGFKVVNQYDRGVILTLGKYTGTRGPGLNWVFPII